MGISQEELDNASKKKSESEMINKSDVKKAVRSNFERAIKQLSIRSSYDQTIMGNLLTSLQIEVEKDIKNLKTEIK